MSETDLVSPETAPAARRRGLTGMVLAELRQLAGELNIPDTAGMRKGDLIAAIKERQVAAPAPAAAPRRRGADTGQLSLPAPDTTPVVAPAGADPTPTTAPRGVGEVASTQSAPTQNEPAEPAVPATARRRRAASRPAGAPAAAGRAGSRAATAAPVVDPAPSVDHAMADDTASVIGATSPIDSTSRIDTASPVDTASPAGTAVGAVSSGGADSTRVISGNGDGAPAGNTDERGTVADTSDTAPVEGGRRGRQRRRADQDAPAEAAAPSVAEPDGDPIADERPRRGRRERAGRSDTENRADNRADNRAENRAESRVDAVTAADDAGDRARGSRDNRNGSRGDTRPDTRDTRPDNRDSRDTRPENRDTRPDARDLRDDRPGVGGEQDDEDGDGRGRRGRRFRDRRRGRDRVPAAAGQGGGDADVRDDDVLLPVAGIVDILDNYAFVRTTGYLAGPTDVYVSLSLVRKHGLRRGDAVTGAVREARDGEQTRQKFNPLVRVDSVNGQDPEAARNRPEFTKLTPLYPNDRLRLETEPSKLTTRVIDLVMPVGKGQRALIVSPPKAGKTTIMQDIANAITTNNPECHLMVVLVDERPEEVTDMQRSVKGEVIASTFDRPPSDHTTVAELSIERAKRLVEMGHDVVVLLDNITRLGRAYNLAAPASGRILSGGVDSTALYPPKRFLGAARNIEDGGSLTIFATALVETGSTMDTVIFEEFKGTGNAELKLDRKIADKRTFPAIDVGDSSTRKDELLMSPDEYAVMVKLRRVLAALDDQQAIDLLLTQLRKTRTNIEFLMQVAKNSPTHDND